MHMPICARSLLRAQPCYVVKMHFLRALPVSWLALPRFAGALLAVAALQQAGGPGVMCLRGVNPYVGAALGDWQRRGGEAPLVPRAAAAAPELHSQGAIAGVAYISNAHKGS